MKRNQLLVTLVLALSILFTSRHLTSAQEQVSITEFMASNTRTLQDEDHEYPDWLEIFNSGTNAVNLLDWSLTDNSDNLTKWRFPATNIGPNQFLIVFASGKNRRTIGAPLHTSFKIGASGGYLALVKPDGSIATEFSPYPGQAPDVSYGFASFTTNITVIATNSPVRWRIPNDSEGDWTGTNYNDSAWTLGTNGLGYGSFSQADYSKAVLQTAPVVYYRLEESSGTTAVNLGSGGTSQNGTYNSVSLGTAGPRPPQFNGFEANNNAPTFNGTSSFVAGPLGVLSGRTAFTVAGWIKPAAAQAARTGLFGQNDALEFGFIDAATIQAWTPNGSVNATYTIPANVWVHIAAVCNGATIRVLTNGVQAGSGSCTGSGSSAFNFNIGGGGIFDVSANFFNGQIDEVAAYQRTLSDAEILSLYQAGTNGLGAGASSLIRTDIGAAMSNVNASVYIRIPFVLTNATNVSLASLRMQYNDGFVASINGVEAFRVNAPDLLPFNAAATNVHASLTAEEFRFGPEVLVTGTNVLAIHGLNVAANDTNFFIGAELVLTSVEADSPNPLFFTVPTPGAANVGGIANPGPAFLSVSNSPNVPLDTQDLTVLAQVSPTFYAVSNVVMRYRIMFGGEIETPMFDDGLHGDGAAGDGVFGATIPESASTNGQMIRWYFRATDVRGNLSRWPLFANPAETAEYLGTIVDPTNVTSKLPIYHIFAPTTVLSPGPTTTQTGADSQAGGRVSIFYDGEFYDNVAMNLRGNSTAGFNKKAHHVNFNREHPFRHTGPGGRIRHTSFTAEYPDPSYMRQYLSFWLAGQMGAPEPFYYPVRLQLNGAFYQLASHNDVVGAEQMQRFGFDPNGALYKAAGTVVPSQFSTGVFEKKTRLNEPNTDYAALANGLAETLAVGQRRTNVFDQLDLPEVINYLVTARWAHENDDVWANMTLYRDTAGDHLWRIIPFDMNLSWGAIFYEGSTPAVIEGVQATNDIHKAFPMYGSSQALALSGPGAPNNFNRMYDVIFTVPETRQMFLRRMRTLLDTHIKPIGTPPNSTAVEALILARRDLIAEEAINDRAKWGWPPKGGQCNFDPGINLTNGVSQMISNFLYLRRIHFYGKHCITNNALTIGIGKDQNAGIPLGQPGNSYITVFGLEANPSSGNQAQEYICLTNPIPFALDISGWKLSGGIDFTFPPGTVMPSNSVIYVSPNVVAFRARTSGPSSGQGLFVVGPYKGQLSARGETIKITDDLTRQVSTFTYADASSAAQQFLRITELMYHPASLLGNTNGAEEFEYVEFKNISPSVTLDLTGIHFTNGIEFNFTGSAITSLAPGATVLIVKNQTAFTNRYGSLPNIAGQYSGYLDNGGERIQLLDASSEEILDFSYNNNWYPITDGLGFSLVVVNEQAEPDAWSSKTNWRPSSVVGGSPGSIDPAPPVIVPVLINEALTRTDTPPPTDTIELFNPTGTTADLSGWFLSDDFATPKKYRIPNGTTLAGGSYRIFDESQFNPTPGIDPSFALSGDSDEVYLFSANTNGNLTGYFHGFTFGAAENNVSFGRHVSSEGKEHFVAQINRTLGTNNAGPKVGPVVINEIMYHPPEAADGSDNSDDEFIELLNISGGPVSLFDSAPIPNAWKISGGVDFTFPANVTLATGEYLLLLNFNPTNVTMLANFRAKYGVSPAVKVFGPYNGKLNNDSDDVELKKPTTILNGKIPYVLVDKVEYKDGAPWAAGADGFGLSLQRKTSSAFGNDPANWAAALPTAAAALSTSGTAPSITSQSPNQTVIGTTTLNLSVAASGDNPLRYQWRLNGTNVANGTNATLQVPNVQPQNGGDYSVAVFNNVGSVVSSNINISVVLASILQAQPQPLTLFPSNNASFSVIAYSPRGPLTYQWRFNGTDINGATNTTYSITNVQPPHDGVYTVAITDQIGTVVSDAARLTVLTHPLFLTQPVSGFIKVGTNAINYSGFSGSATSTTPVLYQWRFNGGNIPGATNASLVVSNVQASNEGDYSLVATDSYGSFTSTNARLTVLFFPVITQQPQSTIVALGGTATFSVTATGTLPMTNSWRRGIPTISTITANSNTSFYSTNNVSTGGVYRVGVVNGAGAALGGLSGQAYLYVVVPPTNVAVNAGENATFRISQVDPGLLTYQWKFNGSPITDATNTSFTVNNVQAANEGPYSVVVTVTTNLVVPAATFTANLSIIRPPGPMLLSPQLVPDGSFHGVLQGQISRTYTVQISPDLTNWNTLTSFTATATSTPFVDVNATNANHRFYRAWFTP